MRATHLSTAMVHLEIGAFRLLTDPTLDPCGTRYHFGPFANSEKTEDTAWDTATLIDRGPIDAVLISHHHHTDNLDYLGRALLEEPAVRRIITHDRWPEDLKTIPDADLDRITETRLGPGAWVRPLNVADKLVPLAEFASTRIERDGEWLEVTCVPALHGRYENWSALRLFARKLFSRRTVGFLIEWSARPGHLVWISGDTIMFEGIHRIAEWIQRQSKQIAVAFMHGGCVGFTALDAMGFGRHTFNGPDMLKAAAALDPALIVPVHYDGWAHFREGRGPLTETLAGSPMADRVRWLTKGTPTELAI